MSCVGTEELNKLQLQLCHSLSEVSPASFFFSSSSFISSHVRSLTFSRLLSSLSFPSTTPPHFVFSPSHLAAVQPYLTRSRPGSISVSVSSRLLPPQAEGSWWNAALCVCECAPLPVSRRTSGLAQRWITLAVRWNVLYVSPSVWAHWCVCVWSLCLPSLCYFYFLLNVRCCTTLWTALNHTRNAFVKKRTAKTKQRKKTLPNLGPEVFLC